MNAMRDHTDYPSPYHTDSLTHEERRELAMDYIIDRLLSDWKESVVFDGTDWIWSITDSTGCIEDGIGKTEIEARTNMWRVKSRLMKHEAESILDNSGSI